ALKIGEGKPWSSRMRELHGFPSPIFSALLNEASPSKNHPLSVHFFIEASRDAWSRALSRRYFFPEEFCFAVFRFPEIFEHFLVRYFDSSRIRLCDKLRRNFI
ncbi:MAG: hypothetical protein IJX22_04100, partial [Opitutales bacterium]|nr:hypothetical protein [Opitutales bacterium]